MITNDFLSNIKNKLYFSFLKVGFHKAKTENTTNRGQTEATLY